MQDIVRDVVNFSDYTDEPHMRDQTKYHWPIQHSVNEHAKAETGKLRCMHVSFVGLQAELSGEINSYWVIQPARPWAGVPEMTHCCPLQDPEMQSPPNCS